jgi:hypothetical protein
VEALPGRRRINSARGRDLASGATRVPGRRVLRLLAPGRIAAGYPGPQVLMHARRGSRLAALAAGW